MKSRIGLIPQYITNKYRDIVGAKHSGDQFYAKSRIFVPECFALLRAQFHTKVQMAGVRRITGFAISFFLVIINSYSPATGIGIKGENIPHPIANGQIIQTTGEVQIQREGRIIYPKTGTVIYPGDKLLTANAARVIIQCANLSTQSISAGKNQANTCPSETEQTECSPGTYKCPHRGEEIAWKDDIPYIISPRRTAIINDKPILRWHPIAGAKVYTVNLEGEGVKWTTQVSDTEIIYPGTPKLQSGVSYLLTVEADTGVSSLDESVRVGGINFRVIEADKAQEISTQAAAIAQQPWSEAAKAIAMANLYSENGLNEDAIAILAASGIQTAPIYRQIGDRYFHYMALIPQAKEYYAKAIAVAEPDDIEEQTQIQYSLGKVEAALGNKAEAMRWFSLALKGYQTLNYPELIDEVERHLRELNSDGN